MNSKHDRQGPAERRPEDRPDRRVAQTLVPPRRFDRTDGRFDLPVVTGRTPQQVARLLA